MALPFKRTVVWFDVNGSSTLRTLTTAGGASSIMSALLAKSNAVIPEWWESVLTMPSGTAVAATYPFASQLCTLIFEDGAGNTARLALPAPVGSIFLPDGVTVDPAQVSAIIAAAQAEVVTTAGNLVTTFVGGTLGKGTVN